MNNNEYEIVIIGGGASGLMLASQLDLGGAPGLILAGSSALGTKLLMSGGGRCNITHGGPVKEFVYAYGDEGQTLRRCLYKHSNLELAKWFSGLGVDLADENGEPVDASYGTGGMDNAGRIFPASGKSRDILNTLIGEAAANLWQIETDAKVSGLRKDGSWVITLINGYELKAENVVIATGGITYPETGSDGSMFEMLDDLGLDINEPRPALAPVYVEDYPYAELSGISIPDVTVIAFSSDAACTCKGKAAKMKGDLLFTHEGLSGPVILNISKYAEPGELIRLCYNKELHELPRRMQRILRDRSRGLLGDVRTNVLASLLDHDDFTVTGVDERGMVTAGGVSLDEIDMRTMAAKRFDGLYVIGEALDADGITGGYNLQLCWSTACTCADDLRSKLCL
ncbi:MAG: aminoacetone oxidase family FAD-binding enzyme [Clostridiales bacterium]|nr:aminoacetone oxidase family FAD-binding enzyme [Clostridiales bacterium]